MRLLAIHVGKPRTMKAADGEEWTSAIHKDPVAGPIRLTKLNLDGDQQASLACPARTSPANSAAPTW